MVTLDSAGGVGGRVRLFSAPADLSDRVEQAWVEERVPRAVSAPATDRIVPDGCSHLLLHVERGGLRRGLGLVGARSVGLEIDKSRRAWTIGVRLRPGQASALFGLDGPELLDRSVALEELLPGSGACTPVLEAPTPEGALTALLELVRRHDRGARPADWRVRAAEELLQSSRGRLSVDGICARIAVPGRTLRKVLRHDLGYGPKRLARIRRIHWMIRQARGRPAVDGAELAAGAGFTDQPHMIREARALLGETPTRFLSRGLTENGVPDTDRFVQASAPAIG